MKASVPHNGTGTARIWRRVRSALARAVISRVRRIPARPATINEGAQSLYALNRHVGDCNSLHCHRRNGAGSIQRIVSAGNTMKLNRYRTVGFFIGPSPKRTSGFRPDYVTLDRHRVQGRTFGEDRPGKGRVSSAREGGRICGRRQSVSTHR